MTRLLSVQRSKHTQFALIDLFAWMTVCCILAAGSSLTGVAPAFWLMAFSLALALDAGPAALAALVAASLAADRPRWEENGDGTGLVQQFMTLLLAAGIAVFHLARRRSVGRKACPNPTAGIASRTDDLS